VGGGVGLIPHADSRNSVCLSGIISLGALCLRLTDALLVWWTVPIP